MIDTRATPPVGKILCTGMVVQQDIGADAANYGDALVLIQTKNIRSPASSISRDVLTIHDTTSSNNNYLNRATRDGPEDQFSYFDSEGDEGEETIPAVAPATSSSTQESSFRELRDQPAAAASLRDNNDEEDQKTPSNRARLVRSNSGRRGRLVQRISYTFRKSHKSLSFSREEDEEEDDAWYVRKTSDNTSTADTTTTEPTLHVMQTVFFDYVGPPEETEEEEEVQNPNSTHALLHGEEEEEDDGGSFFTRILRSS